MKKHPTLTMPHKTPPRAQVIRAADAPQVTGLPFARITRIDEKNRLVTVRATDEGRDSFDTGFRYEASKEAFQAWMGNIREMHQAKAVGRAVEVAYDDAARAIDVTLRVSKGAPDTWEKILDGTLQGASIGANDVVWEMNLQRAHGGPAKVATKYKLVELSLVDNPSNPSCKIMAIRAAHIDPTILDESETPMPTETETQEAAVAAALTDTTNSAPALPVPEVARAITTQTGLDGYDLAMPAQDATRAGARISAESQTALHDIRDQGVGQVMRIAEHCGCANCRAIVLLLNPAEADDDEADEDEEDDDEMNGSMRAQFAVLTRQMGAMNTQVATLADATAAVVDYLQTSENATEQRLAAVPAPAPLDLTPLTTQLDEVRAALAAVQGLVPEVSALRGLVERIAAQEAPGGPVVRGQAPDTFATELTPQHFAAIEAMARRGQVSPDVMSASAQLQIKHLIERDPR